MALVLLVACGSEGLDQSLISNANVNTQANNTNKGNYSQTTFGNGAFQRDSVNQTRFCTDRDQVVTPYLRGSQLERTLEGFYDFLPGKISGIEDITACFTINKINDSSNKVSGELTVEFEDKHGSEPIPYSHKFLNRVIHGDIQYVGSTHFQFNLIFIDDDQVVQVFGLGEENGITSGYIRFAELKDFEVVSANDHQHYLELMQGLTVAEQLGYVGSNTQAASGFNYQDANLNYVKKAEELLNNHGVYLGEFHTSTDKILKNN